MARSILTRDLAAIAARLRTANTRLAAAYPGDAIARQPVHTLICSADAFTRDSAQMYGAAAVAALNEFGPTASSFAKTLGLTSDDSTLTETVRARVMAKLKREPVEDLRLDFEDGYGVRPDAEEDGHAQSAAREIAAGNDRRHVAAVHRHPDQGDVARAARAQPPHARPVRDRAREDRQAAARQLCDHRAEGDDADACGCGRSGLHRARAAAEAEAQQPAAGVDDRDATVDPRAGRDLGAARAGGRRRRPRAGRAFRRLRLHRARAASPRRGSTRATSPATSRGT